MEQQPPPTKEAPDEAVMEEAPSPTEDTHQASMEEAPAVEALHEVAVTEEVPPEAEAAPQEEAATAEAPLPREEAEETPQEVAAMEESPPPAEAEPAADAAIEEEEAATEESLATDSAPEATPPTQEDILTFITDLISKTPIAELTVKGIVVALKGQLLAEPGALPLTGPLRCTCGGGCRADLYPPETSISTSGKRRW